MKVSGQITAVSIGISPQTSKPFVFFHEWFTPFQKVSGQITTLNPQENE